jgi:catechol 2,3-dioxygenase-like lactoylglutathione lyase family enzyme
MIDHIGLRVTDFDKSRQFYVEALKPLGYTLLRDYPGVCGFGAGGKPDFWITKSETTVPSHIAFLCESRAIVHAFHEAGMKAGGKDFGAPGKRDYHEHYYGAFILDPDGHNIEAVVHKPE